MTLARLDALIQDIRLVSETNYDIVQAVRKAALSTAAGVTEEVKYGGILFSGSKAFAGVFAYTEHVSVEFGDGASLVDAHQVLEGQGKLRRHIKLRSLAELQAKHVLHYLALAHAQIKP